MNNKIHAVMDSEIDPNALLNAHECKPAPGNLFIVAAPSGAGKTSLVKNLIKRLARIQVSISHTTRAPRPREKNEVDYFFINEKEFLNMVEEKLFIEYANVFGHFYGTSIVQIKNRLAAGIDIVLDIDWQGARQIRTMFPKAVSVFILPPSLDVLRDRLLKRGQDKAKVIQLRMERAQAEMSHYTEFDYIIINDLFSKAAEQLRAIVIADRLSLERQACHLASSLSFLLSSG